MKYQKNPYRARRPARQNLKPVSKMISVDVHQLEAGGIALALACLGGCCLITTLGSIPQITYAVGAILGTCLGAVVAMVAGGYYEH